MAASLGFIGLGNMGSALLNGILHAEDSPHFNKYYIYDVVEEKLRPYKGNNKIIICSSLDDLVEHSEYILIAIKPQHMANLLSTLKSKNIDGKKFISIAAGLTIDFYKKYLGQEASITRVMPNTPFLVGEGAAGITFDKNLSPNEKEAITWIFERAGKIIECDEHYLDVVTGLSGSGPAYIFVVIEALADGAVSMGLNRKDAYTLAAQMVLGSAKMVLETGKHPGELKDMVTSPGGTTIEAIRVLEKNNVRSAFIEAVIAATRKSQSFHE